MNAKTAWWVAIPSIIFTLGSVAGWMASPELVLTTITDTSREESIMVQWVYDHSTLISRAQCKELVQEVMKTKRPELMLAIIELESKKFQPGAQSYDKSGRRLARGWCQINIQEHGQELAKAGIIREERDLWDAGPNIKAGAYILEQKFKLSKGNVVKALEGYLGGKDGTYVLRVLSNYADIMEAKSGINMGAIRSKDVDKGDNTKATSKGN